MTKRRSATSEDQAQQLLEELGIDVVPVPVERIPGMLGAELRYSPLDEELSGMAYVKDGVPIIGVNSLHHPNRQRFTIAHEIAHVRMHRDFITNSVHVDKTYPISVLRRDKLSAAGTEYLEIQANKFAAALLVPRKKLEQFLSERQIDIDDEGALDACARKFRVSRAMLNYRISNLLAELG